jgi:hypothetical protein
VNYRVRFAALVLLAVVPHNTPNPPVSVTATHHHYNSQSHTIHPIHLFLLQQPVKITTVSPTQYTLSTCFCYSNPSKLQQSVPHNTPNPPVSVTATLHHYNSQSHTIHPIHQFLLQQPVTIRPLYPLCQRPCFPCHVSPHIKLSQTTRCYDLSKGKAIPLQAYGAQRVL